MLDSSEVGNILNALSTSVPAIKIVYIRTYACIHAYMYIHTSDLSSSRSSSSMSNLLIRVSTSFWLGESGICGEAGGSIWQRGKGERETEKDRQEGEEETVKEREGETVTLVE